MKDNVGPTYSMMGFIREYDRVIETINKNERLEESYSNQKTPKENSFLGTQLNSKLLSYTTGTYSGSSRYS